jgi:hypothetical protein
MVKIIGHNATITWKKITAPPPGVLNIPLPKSLDLSQMQEFSVTAYFNPQPHPTLEKVMADHEQKFKRALMREKKT